MTTEAGGGTGPARVPRGRPYPDGVTRSLIPPA
jgi:hypothetical protein